MINKKDLLNLSETIKINNFEVKNTLENLEENIRTYINAQIKGKEYDIKNDKSKLEALIISYINNNPDELNIPEFINKEQKIEKNKLLKAVIDDILNYGIIQEFINNPKINEIRSIGRWIEVQDINNNTYFPKNASGQRVKFNSPEEQSVIIKKMLISNTKPLNYQNKLLNARTIEGYRISATHFSAKANSDIDEENGYSDFTLRKFRDKIFTLDELANIGTINIQMAKLFKYIITNESVAVIGRTGSGKTVTLRAMLEEIPNELRVINIQQPTEYDLRKYNKKGELINDRLMWEADEENILTSDDELLKNTNTLNNLIAQTLRNTPDIIAINEIRHPDEFASAILVGQAGHSINLTYHADNIFQGCQIFTNKYISYSQQEYSIGLMDVTSIFRFMILQTKLSDGSRVITDVSEILGIDENNKNLPKINTLYKYKITGKSKEGKILGEHIKVGNISQNTREKMLQHGITEAEIMDIDPDFKKV